MVDFVIGVKIPVPTADRTSECFGSVPLVKCRHKDSPAVYHTHMFICNLIRMLNCIHQMLRHYVHGINVFMYVLLIYIYRSTFYIGKRGLVKA